MPTKKKKKTVTAKKTSRAQHAKKAPARKKAPVKDYGPRKDLGAPVEGFFAKQPPGLAPVLSELRTMVQQAAPDATSAIKWGMPFYSIGGTLVCAIAAHKSHVNLILPGPPGTYADPAGRLEGEGKTGRHLKLKTLGDLPRASVQGWLKTAVRLARKGD